MNWKSNSSVKCSCALLWDSGHPVYWNSEILTERAIFIDTLLCLYIQGGVYSEIWTERATLLLDTLYIPAPFYIIWWSGCVLHVGCHVCSGNSAPSLRHHLPPLLPDYDLEPQQPQSGRTRRISTSCSSTTQEEEIIKWSSFSDLYQ